MADNGNNRKFPATSTHTDITQFLDRPSSGESFNFTLSHCPGDGDGGTGVMKKTCWVVGGVDMLAYHGGEVRCVATR